MIVFAGKEGNAANIKQTRTEFNVENLFIQTNPGSAFRSAIDHLAKESRASIE
jgi:hypothetical protein